MFELFLVAIIAAGAYWFWQQGKPDKGGWFSDEQNPGEKWKLVEMRDYSAGSVRLSQSEIGSYWVVQRFSTQGKSQAFRFHTEDEAPSFYASTQ